MATLTAQAYSAYGGWYGRDIEQYALPVRSGGAKRELRARLRLSVGRLIRQQTDGAMEPSHENSA